jgi:raffinose/stachyose/melibiose transport system substrate-binding protein
MSEHILRRSHRRRRAVAFAAAAAATFLVAACSSSSSSTSASSSSSGPVTLWVQNGDGGSTALLAGYAALNKQFEAAHPGVTIKFTVKNFNDLVNTLKLQLSGSNVPDVTQDNQGYGSLGQLVTDHLVAPLDGTGSTITWTGRQSDSLLALDGRFSPDGKTMGSGSLYGIAATGAWVGLFENTALAKSLGITSMPTTLAQLESDMAAAKAKGIVPLMYGTSDGGEPLWLDASLLMSIGGPTLLTNVVDGTSSTLPPQMQTVGQTIDTWSKDGYFTPGWAAYTNNDVLNKFAKGEGLFALNGSWNVPLSAPAAQLAKFRLLPFPLAASGSLASIATGDLPWSIPAKSAHPTLAAQYIDFITSPAADATWIAHGQVPASITANEAALVSQNHLTGTSADAVNQWVALESKGTTEPFIDWSTPTFYNTMASATESLGGGKITPTQFVAQLQADYGPFTTKRMGNG